MKAPVAYSPLISRAELDQLEALVATGKITAYSLYTKMRTLITIDSPEVPELEEWRQMFWAATSPDEFKPVEAQALWPNPWSKHVAMTAHLIHTMRQQIKAMTTWQPMETVPTDNTPVLVLLETHERSRGGERIQHAMFHKSAHGSTMGTIGDHFTFDKPKALGWMLPPPIPAGV